MGGEEVGDMLFSAMGEMCMFLKTGWPSFTPTPTDYHPLLSYIGCLFMSKGVFVCTYIKKNSTLLLLYLEWWRFYIGRGGGFMLCQPQVCSINMEETSTRDE